MRKLIVDGIGPVAEISIAPLFGTALWFSANSTAGNLVNIWHISAADIGRLASAMQLGFILGTYVVSLSGAVDRIARAEFSFAARSPEHCSTWASRGWRWIS
ncbi:hypothetical protein VSR82_37330 [Burkholderia sp. JPY481]|uniref:hypothetical protein n=1 Tax=Paraburkholderia sp. EG304 TaxID=3237015 RepID=UPI0031818798